MQWATAPERRDRPCPWKPLVAEERKAARVSSAARERRCALPSAKTFGPSVAGVATTSAFSARRMSFDPRARTRR